MEKLKYDPVSLRSAVALSMTLSSQSLWDSID